MPYLLRNITLDPGQDEAFLLGVAARRLGLAPCELLFFRIVRKGVDARKKGGIKLVYTVGFSLAGKRLTPAGDLVEVPEPEEMRFARAKDAGALVVVGMGPAGLFTALRLAEYGLKPLVVERGKPVEERSHDVSILWRDGVLDPESNVQFGEGGAGTFSDGKLTTRVKDENATYVLETLVRYGAPPEILYQAKPHIGTDRLKKVVGAIREALIAAGCEIAFQKRLTGIGTREGKVRAVVVNDHEERPCDALVLAPGHSARDTYLMLQRMGVALQAKPFAVGVRVEHPQALIDTIQYGRNRHPSLPPADYQLAYNNRETGRSAYSFCMCPGGVVVCAASEEGGVVVNGMSGYRRNSPFANSALVVNVGVDDFAGSSPLAGVEFQRELERRAFAAAGGGYLAPAQDLLSFVGKGRGVLSSTLRPGIVECDLSTLFPSWLTGTLREGIGYFDRKMRGFLSAEATLTGVETRTSAPVRILRGPDLQSVSHPGLYPAGEGAGYAGGIMSAALDGVRVADAIAGRITG